MKVTVCFGSTRVIVPCGRGEILVKDLIQLAITRYKKATGKSSFSQVTVHSLQSQSDGGILDPDDRLRDVADDREQIIAFYEDGDRNSPQQHAGGDGTSVTSSPEIFRNQDEELQNDIEVTNEQISNTFQSLHVRRGSEPALNQLPLFNSNNMGKKMNCIRPITSGQSKRWSAAPMTYESKEKLKTNECVYNKNDLSNKVHYIEENVESTDNFLASTFNRDSTNRLSIQFLGESSGGFRWGESNNITNNRPLSLSLPRNHRRKEPLGQSKTIDSNNLLDSQNIQFIVLKTEGGSLGIHVVPDYNSLGKEFGLLVQGIEPNGRVHCDGRLKMYDRIIEINGRSLLDQPFNAIQEIFRDSLHSPELRLKVIKHKNNIDIEIPQNIVNKKQLPLSSDNLTTNNNNSPLIKEDISLRSSNENINSDMKIDNLSSTNKLSVGPTTSNILMAGNTRKIGKILELELIKGPHGLGFSITTRDNPTRGNCPIYIKNVLPKGAAIKDGRLKTGDRILSVNNIEFTGISQSDAVAILRKIPSGAKVKIIVSRQEEVINRDEKKSSDDINEFIENKSTENKLFKVKEDSDYNSVQEYKNNLEDTYPLKHKDIITFKIPVHDTEKAGLGISVKGKTSSNITNDKHVSQDLGIFIKNIINGGAASRDNRLQTNDQLIYINGVSLIGKSNSSAMELLRKTMMNVDSNIPIPGAISLTIARQRNTSPSLYRRLSRDSSISLLTDSSANTETFGCSINNSYTQNMMEYSETDEKSNNNLINQRQDVENTNLNQISNTDSPNEILFHNPVLERLTTNYYGLRNESYLQATHKTILSKEEKCMLKSPITNKSSEEILIIQEDIPKYNPDINSQNESKHLISKSKDSRATSTSTDVTYASQLSLDNGNLGFSRDAFGRRSMSEKRHTTLDSRNTNYQTNKKLLEKGINENQSNELRPLGIKKSSSLESLQTVKINKNIHKYDNENYYQQITGFQKSLNSQIDYKTPDKPPIENKKKGSLLKGIANIGSIFRFGKPQRGLDINYETNSIHNEQELARKNICNEQIRIKKQHQKLINEEKTKMPEQNHDIPLDKVKTNYSSTYKTLSNHEQTRIDRIQQLKNEHHKRHMERSENYSSQKNHEFDFNQHNSNNPSSPVGLMDSSRFNHYVNFQEIQHNLNRKQLQYHSQRRNSKESIARPTSNYYEYESVMKSLPYINSIEEDNISGGMNLVDNNSNSLIRQVDGACTTDHSQQSSKQHPHYPVTGNKSSNYDTYNNIEKVQNGIHQKSHRVSPVSDTNYNRLYQHNNYNYQPIKLQEPLYYTRHH